MKYDSFHSHHQNVSGTYEFFEYEDLRSIQDLIADYRHFEALCDEETERLETLSRSIEQRVKTDVEKAGGTWSRRFQPAQEADRPAHAEFKSSRDNTVEREKFLARSRAARKFHLPYRVFAGDSIVHGTTDRELEMLEDSDAKIRLYLFQLSELESQILGRLPETEDEAIDKLKFISCLFIEENNVDVDTFAFIVREAAEQLEHILSRKVLLS